MDGSEIIPRVMTLAPTIPVDAARIAPTRTTEMAIPPRRCPNSRAMVSSSSSAMPDFSRATPMKTKRGTASSVKFVIVPQIRMGRMFMKSARSKPKTTPSTPKNSPVKVRLKATGNPKNRKAIIPANMKAARIWSSGRPVIGSVNFLDGLLRRLPAHRPVEGLDRLRDPLDEEESEAHDDHRLEEPAERKAARVR